MTTTTNTCLFNFRCNQLNSHVSKNIVKKEGFSKGQEIVCKLHYKTSKTRLYVNYRYTIKRIKMDGLVIINEPVENKDMYINVETLLKHFKLPYANTCDLVQGMSLNDKITIFDCNTPYVDRYYIWTALTRATALKNVQIFEHSVYELMNLKKSWVKLYFTQKIQGYKQQDKKAGRNEIKDYIDAEWFKTQYRTHKNCSLCEVSILRDHKVTSNITADRIDNNKSHVKSNSRLMSIKCNTSKQ